MPTYRNDGDRAFKVEDSSGETVSVNPGFNVSTFKILGAPFTKTSDEPFFSLTRVNVTLTSPGTQTGLLSCKVIRLTAKASGITMKCNVAANTNVFSLPANVSIDIRNDGEIEALIFIGAGEVTLEGF
jgi:hypothetical protein